MSPLTNPPGGDQARRQVLAEAGLQKFLLVASTGFTAEYEVWDIHNRLHQLFDSRGGVFKLLVTPAFDENRQNSFTDIDSCVDKRN